MVSIELVLDEDTEARVRADWSRLADAGLSSMAANRSASNRPHITILVRPSLDDSTAGDPALAGATSCGESHDAALGQERSGHAGFRDSASGDGRPGDERFGAAVALLPLKLTLAEPIVFRHGTRGVLARRVAASGELLELHRAIHAAVPEGADAPRTRPGEWAPHVTLARRLRLDALPQALQLLGDEREGRGTALRRWDSASATIRLLG